MTRCDDLHGRQTATARSPRRAPRRDLDALARDDSRHRRRPGHEPAMLAAGTAAACAGRAGRAAGARGGAPSGSRRCPYSSTDAKRARRSALELVARRTRARGTGSRRSPSRSTCGVERRARPSGSEHAARLGDEALRARQVLDRLERARRRRTRRPRRRARAGRRSRTRRCARRSARARTSIASRLMSTPTTRARSLGEERAAVARRRNRRRARPCRRSTAARTRSASGAARRFPGSVSSGTMRSGGSTMLTSGKYP